MFRFIEFKGFADAGLDLSVTPVTILIGRNGSGKSNAIEGVELLSQLVRGMPLHEIGESGRGTRHELRGGLLGAARKNARSFRLEALDAAGLRYEVEIRVRPSAKDIEGPSVWHERLAVDGEVLYEAARRGIGQLRVSYAGDGARRRQINLPSSSARVLLLTQVARESLFAELQSALVDLQALVPEVKVVDPVASVMRNYERRHQRRLARNGSNLSAVLHSLHVSRELADRQALASILEDVRGLPEEPVAAFDFVTTPNDVKLALRRDDGSLVDASVLSDGFLRALAIVTALATAEPGMLVVVEEIDNGLHPSRAKALLDAAWRHARERGAQLLVTTHNPALLDGLDDEQMRGVVLCHWDANAGASRLTRLTDLPDPWAILREGELGGLVTREAYRPQLEPGYAERRVSGALARVRQLQVPLNPEGTAA